MPSCQYDQSFQPSIRQDLSRQAQAENGDDAPEHAGDQDSSRPRDIQPRNLTNRYPRNDGLWKMYGSGEPNMVSFWVSYGIIMLHSGGGVRGTVCKPKLSSGTCFPTMGISMMMQFQCHFFETQFMDGSQSINQVRLVNDFQSLFLEFLDMRRIL